MRGVVYYVFNQRGDRFARIREVLVHFQPRAAAVEVRLAVLVDCVERGVVQRGLWLKFCFPLFEQFFGRCVGVICVNNLLPPCLDLRSPELTFAYACTDVRLF